MVPAVTLLWPRRCLLGLSNTQAIKSTANFDAKDRVVALSCYIYLHHHHPPPLHNIASQVYFFFSLSLSLVSFCSVLPPFFFFWIHYTFLISCSCAATIYRKWVWKVVSWVGASKETLRWYQSLIFTYTLIYSQTFSQLRKHEFKRSTMLTHSYPSACSHYYNHTRLVFNFYFS